MRISIALFMLALLSCNAIAQHSDIWITVNNNQIVVSAIDLDSNQPVKTDLTTGRFLFTGDFSDLGQGPQGTDDPGYQAQAGVLQANAILNYRATGHLQYWDGNQWSNTVNDQESIVYTDALGSQTIWTSSGITQAEGAIDQVLANGSIHSHIDFSIDNNGNTPAQGAYIIDLELFVTSGIGGPIVHAVSEPLRIVFNYQLNSSDFDLAITALTSPQAEDEDIPFLPPWALLSLGIVFMHLSLKLKKKKQLK